MALLKHEDGEVIARVNYKLPSLKSDGSIEARKIASSSGSIGELPSLKSDGSIEA